MPAQRDLVINTGPVLALTAAGHFEILRELFARVVVPYEVVQEIEAGGRTQFAAKSSAPRPGWISASPLLPFPRFSNPRSTPERLQ
jgi:predicted nucleic acid-binding protein